MFVEIGKEKEKETKCNTKVDGITKFLSTIWRGGRNADAWEEWRTQRVG
jgi:hypothetical protein